MTTAERIAAADEYLNARTGAYELRCERYDAALEAMHGLGLHDSCTVLDVGAGMGEFGARMHSGSAEYVVGAGSIKPSRARYWPVDAALDGTDLEQWSPPRRVEWIVCLEVLEHLTDPWRLAQRMIRNATRGVVVSTPNPATTDVLGMDPTHRTPIDRGSLASLGFRVETASFYGKPADSLFAVWSPLFVY